MQQLRIMLHEDTVNSGCQPLVCGFPAKPCSCETLSTDTGRAPDGGEMSRASGRHSSRASLPSMRELLAEKTVMEQGVGPGGGDLEAGESCKTLAELMGDDVSVVAEGSTGEDAATFWHDRGGEHGEEVVHEGGCECLFHCMAMVLDDCAKADVRVAAGGGAECEAQRLRAMVVSALTTRPDLYAIGLPVEELEDHVKRWLLGETVPGRYQLEALAQILKVEIRVFEVTTRGTFLRVYPHRRPANDGAELQERPAGGAGVVRMCQRLEHYWPVVEQESAPARQLAQRLDDYVLAKDPDSYGRGGLGGGGVGAWSAQVGELQPLSSGMADLKKRLPAGAGMGGDGGGEVGLWRVGLLLEGEVRDHVKEVIADIVGSPAFAAVRALDGGEALVSFHECGSGGSEGAAPLVVPLKQFESGEIQARAVWRAVAETMPGGASEPIEVMTASLRLMLRRSEGGGVGSQGSEGAEGEGEELASVSLGLDRAALVPVSRLVVAVEKAALQQGVARAREPLQASVQIANVDGGRVRNASAEQVAALGALQGYLAGLKIAPASELVQCLCLMRSRNGERDGGEGDRGEAGVGSEEWSVEEVLELVRNDVSDGGGEKKASVTAVSDAGSEGGRIDAAGGRGEGSGAAGGAAVGDAVESGGDWGGLGGAGRADDLQRVVGVGLDRGGTPGFYYLGRREGYVKIQEGQVVVFSGFIVRDTLKHAQFTWNPSDKTWRQPLNQALRVLRIDVEEPRVGEEDDDLVITRAIASLHNQV